MKSFKRILSSILVFCLLAGFAPAAFAAQDVTDPIFVGSGEDVTVGNVTVTGNYVAIDVSAGDENASLHVEGTVSQTAENDGSPDISINPINVYSLTAGSNAAVTVDGNVEGNAPSGCGVSGSARGGEAIADIGGSVTLELGPMQDEFHGGIGVSSGVAGFSGSSAVTVGGNVEVSSDVNGVSGVDTNIQASYWDWDDVNQQSVQIVGSSTTGTASVSVDGDITVSGNNNPVGVRSFIYDGGSSEVTVGGDINSSSASGSDAMGIDIEAKNNGKSHTEVGGDITVSGASNTNGIMVNTVEGGETSIAVEGGVQSQTTTSCDHVNGVAVTMGGESGSVDISVGEDVSASGDVMSASGVFVDIQPTYWDWDEENQQSYRVGGSTTTSGASVSVDGNVSAEGRETATGAGFYVQGGGSGEVTVGGDVSAHAASGNDSNATGVNAFVEDNSTINAEVGGDVSASSDNSATGVSAQTLGGGAVDVSVSGSVAATVENAAGNASWSNGVYASAAGESGSVDVSVDGGVTVSGDALYSDGVVAQVESSYWVWDESEEKQVHVVNDSTTAAVSISVGDDVSVNAVENANAVIAYAEGGSSIITVNGDVTASAGTWAMAVGATAREGAQVTVDVDGSISAEAAGASAIQASSLHSGLIDVSVSGDVSSSDIGLSLSYYTSPSDAPGRINVTIEGTLSGENAPILVAGDVSENVELTVWAIEPTEDGSIVVPSFTDPADVPAELAGQVEESNSKLAAAAEVFEKCINYIVKMLQPDKGGTMSTEGTTRQGDYDVAHEGDTVTVKLNVAEGYKLDAVYNGDGEKVELLRDGNGNYYIVVPKGGGIMLSAALSQVSAEEPAPIIVPIQKPAAEPAPEKTEIAEENLDSAEASVTVEPEAPAEGGEGQAEEEAAAAPVSAVVKFYDDKSFELVITTFSAEEPEKVDSVERVEGSFLLVDGVLTLKLADGREIQIDEDGVFVISLPDGRSVRIKLDPATIGKLLLNA